MPRFGLLRALGSVRFFARLTSSRESKMGLRAYGVAVVSASAAFWLMSGTLHETSVLASSSDGALRSLEAGVAAHPGDTAALGALAQAYLDARQPGLAVVLVETAPTFARADARVQHVYARALVDEGRSAEALVAERLVITACGPVVDGAGAAAAGCDPLLLVSAIRRADILGQLVLLGVQDAQAHPEETMVAYQNATREARVMVQ
jgi:hypothetical protein